MGLVRSIPVRGENGDELTVYEFQDRRFIRNVRRLKLCTGQTVHKDGGVFVIAGTGERLIRMAAAAPQDRARPRTSPALERFAARDREDPFPWSSSGSDGNL